ncbi:MAG: prepilin-type cleavage/methylation domain-containing protein [Clostridiaceae bacterium]|nr:prepilin-type cleavage/methylation domain-containing protein [Clostridiaceae bacterium]
MLIQKANSFRKILFKNKTGLTLIEALVAILMIGIVSVGITSLVFSLSRTSKMSEEILRQNAVCRVIKENVVMSARDRNDIHGNAGSVASGSGTNLADLIVLDRSGNVYPEYSFDVLYVDNNEESDYGELSDKLEKYKISLRNSNNTVLTEFFIEVYIQ